MKDKKYYKCSKCGQVISEGVGSVCTSPAPWRTSGICGGSISTEITKEEYDTTILNWEKKRDEEKCDHKWITNTGKNPTYCLKCGKTWGF